jgi:hypothetical protein
VVRTDYFRVVTLVAAMAAAAVVAVMMALGTAGMAFAAPCDPSACGADG